MGVADEHGLDLSTTAEAAACWREFCHKFQRRASGDTDSLEACISADPSFAVARATAAVTATALGRDFDPDAELAAALRGTAEHEWERSYVAAAASAVDARGLVSAVEAWTDHHDHHPADLNGLLFSLVGASFSTDRERIAAITDRFERTRTTIGDHPFVVGVLAMQAQDRFELEQAETLARRALELDPTGFDGAHPLSHVYFERGDHAEGADWLTTWLPTADQESNFIGHVYWHRTLHLLELGRHDDVCAEYEHRLGAAAAIGLFDRTSLLWRLQLHGIVPPGVDPISPGVDDIVAPILDDIPVAFAGVHAALGLAGRSDADGLRRLAETARQSGTPGASELVAPISSAFAALVEGDVVAACEQLLAIESEFDRLGGSHAQREVFEDTLIDSLIGAGRFDEARDRLHVRLARRPSSLDAGRVGRLG